MGEKLLLGLFVPPVTIAALLSSTTSPLIFLFFSDCIPLVHSVAAEIDACTIF